MTPVNQEFTHQPELGIYGDCQRAVIASLLDLPISDVPHFFLKAKENTPLYWALLQKFLISKGFVYQELPSSADRPEFSLDDYHEIAGTSPRGHCLHAVVGRNGKIVHDPHPDNAGLTGNADEWTHSYLIKLQPHDYDAEFESAIERLNKIIEESDVTI